MRSPIVYYFSGTGNSLTVARDLVAALAPAELVAIPTALKGPIEPLASTIGIVFPVYMAGLPLIVDEFCKKLNPQEPAYIYGVATHGGMPGGTLLQLRRCIEARAMIFSAGFAVKMPGNYTPLYGAPPEEKQKRLFAEEKESVREIAQYVKAKVPGPVESSNILVNLLATGILYQLGASRIRTMDRSFRVTDRCNGCGLCEKVCPAADIEMRGGKPAWLGRCEQCMACLQWCPQEAIEVGRRTVGRRRYHHPDVTAKDMMLRG
jgi:Pyruvate/2-oxoacid:ferredoxin oxidoreductase delta subunit